ncbi:hypothetical protein [Muriicola sp.]|uniref:hypothetical protein n=1 Tax=Muriicola sp. TaxID=2020856 RepID=UPI003C72FE93
MKLIVKVLLLLITLLPWNVLPQEDKDGEDLTGFYRTMAIADAQMEQSLTFGLEEDEMDYWRDQYNFEKNLKQENYTAYKTYIFFKRRSYLEHQQGCDIATNHGKGYNKQASFYRVHGQVSLNGKRIGAIDLTASPTVVSQRNKW